MPVETRYEPVRITWIEKNRRPLQLLLYFSFLFFLQPLFAQTPNQLINGVNEKFKKVNDYTAAVKVACDIPFIRIDPINGKVYYKKPDHFKVKSTGILILPKQNINFYYTAIADTLNYTAVKSGEEVIAGKKTQVISVIPHTDTSDLVLGKFWIDETESLVLKSQLTTKSQGTILIEEFYSDMRQYALPEKMIFTVDVQKFKVPKIIAVDINKTATADKNAAKDQKGKITLTFSSYEVNKGIDNNVFK
jgi:outer membrane lipoprotein-sorting protein